MKNKNALRSKLGLYIEGLRQSRVIGLPFACIAALLLVIDIIDAFAKMGSYAASMNRYYEPGEGFAIIFYTSFCVAAPLMLLMLFHFLNSRSASDFYHAIPRSRTSLYFSFAAAVLTWTVGSASALLLAEGIFHSIIGSIHVGDWLVIWLDLVSANVLLAGGVLLAISISSTVFSQVIITGLILFLPRAFISLFESAVTTLAPVLPSFEREIGFLGGPRANVIIGYLLYDMEGAIAWQAGIYSLILGLVYAVLGMFFFNRRKSEAAASPALNRWVQMAVRVIIAFVLCLIPTTDIINSAAYGYGIDIDSLVEYIVLYALALIVYFVYEAISNRSIKGLAQSWRELLIGLAVLVGLNIALVAGANICSSAVLSFSPENDEVVSISMPAHSYRNVEYEELVLENTEITDREIVDLLAARLRDCTDNIEKVRQQYAYYSGDVGNNPYEYENMITFNLANGRSVIRNVYSSYNQAMLLDEMLMRNADYVNAAVSMPPVEEVDSFYAYGGFNAGIKDEDCRALYESYLAEVQAMDKVEYLTDMGENIFNIEVGGKYNGIEYESNYKITLKTPETLTMFIEYVNAKESFSEVWAKGIDGGYCSISATGYNFYNNGIYYESFNQYYEKSLDYYYKTVVSGGSAMETVQQEIYGSDFFLIDENRQLLIDEIIANEGKPVDVSKPFYHIALSIEMPVETTYEGGYTITTRSTYSSYDFFVQADEENSCLLMPGFVEYEGE